jgi:hypothetical protein
MVGMERRGTFIFRNMVSRWFAGWTVLDGLLDCVESSCYAEQIVLRPLGMDRLVVED